MDPNWRDLYNAYWCGYPASQYKGQTIYLDPGNEMRIVPCPSTTTTSSTEQAVATSTKLVTASEVPSAVDSIKVISVNDQGSTLSTTTSTTVINITPWYLPAKRAERTSIQRGLSSTKAA